MATHIYSGGSAKGKGDAEHPGQKAVYRKWKGGNLL